MSLRNFLWDTAPLGPHIYNIWLNRCATLAHTYMQSYMWLHILCFITLIKARIEAINVGLDVKGARLANLRPLPEMSLAPIEA